MGDGDSQVAAGSVELKPPRPGEESAEVMVTVKTYPNPSDKYLEVWRIVLRAKEAAEAVIRAGVSGVVADTAAREVIAGAGYGEYFGHGLGHGVGLAVHEGPRASRLSEDTLQAGMSLTVEPGIYLPGEFGVRIEDLVIIGEHGIEILTNTPKMPLVDA